MNIIKLIVVAWLVFQSPSAWTAAYTPKDDAEVLERLPVATGERKRLRELRIQLNENPGDYRLALDLARDYIALGRSNSDPRYYGYAETLLNAWLRTNNLQPDALVLRATILQNRHDFQAALADLKVALKLNPRLPQAWLTLAAVFEVQGDYPSALRSCLALAKFSAALPAAICINSALSLSGQARPSYTQLASAVADVKGDPEELTWAYVILAEIAERLDLGKEAESWYQKAVALGRRSVYLLTTYSDFLLDHNRPAEVLDLLQGETRADALLLRLTLAEQRLQRKQFNEHADLIKDRIAAAKSRGDTVHQGDESRFVLHVLKDNQTALKLAISNWAVQKEPRDARILLEAAVTAKQPDAALPVIKFMEQTHLEDARLMPLLKLAKG
ncbi:tetratricopeptide repeat protein [Methyloglobulus sp.]|uniref:tetratricopeptide repeat protein n=1 Tax=Methyloglobulus sp. TaxID=2518622 RepID=UPI003988C857